MRRRPVGAAAVAVAVVGVLAAVVLAEPGGAAGASSAPRLHSLAPLTWEPCGDGGECAGLVVPLDYKHPRNGKTVSVALFRVPARDPGQRIGSLLLNPGGPGASGVSFVRAIYDLLPDELKDRFDVVGFDPRGTGGTIPVDCGDVIDETYSFDYTPDTPEERAALLQGTEAVVRKCEEANPRTLRFVATTSTVRDMERVRRALGDRQLTYVGYSYGTYLGALYADRYPKRVRAFVLDGAVDPELSAREAALQQAGGFEGALNAFLESCSAARGCAFGSGDAAAAYDELVARIDGAPVPSNDGRVLGPGTFELGVLKALYEGEGAYDDLGDALASAAAGDAGPMFELADEYTRRNDPDGHNALEAFWAIGCRDGERLGAPSTFARLEPRFRAAAPRLGVALLNYGLMCAHWPVPPVDVDLPLRAKSAPPVVVVGTIGDPATPSSWAQALATQLASAVLVTADGGRHTSFLLAGLPCIDEYGVRYLVDLVVPPDNAHCGLSGWAGGGGRRLGSI